VVNPPHQQLASKQASKYGKTNSEYLTATNAQATG
jgi:hypothetical protein